MHSGWIEIRAHSTHRRDYRAAARHSVKRYQVEQQIARQKWLQESCGKCGRKGYAQNDVVERRGPNLGR